MVATPSRMFSLPPTRGLGLFSPSQPRPRPVTLLSPLRLLLRRVRPPLLGRPLRAHLRWPAAPRLADWRRALRRPCRPPPCRLPPAPHAAGRGVSSSSKSATSRQTLAARRFRLVPVVLTSQWSHKCMLFSMPSVNWLAAPPPVRSVSRASRNFCTTMTHQRWSVSMTFSHVQSTPGSCSAAASARSSLSGPRSVDGAPPCLHPA